MVPNKFLKKQVLEVVKTQIKTNDPPETNQTIDRLKQDGISEDDAKGMVAQCVTVELFDVLKNKKPFNYERFVRNLNNLPDEPEE